MSDSEERAYFEEGLSYVASRLAPRTTVVYGAAPNEIFGKYRDFGIEIVQFDSETSVVHSRHKAVA